MKKLKFLFVFFIGTLAVLQAKSQIVERKAQMDVFSTKFTKDMVWDVQRDPAYPNAGQTWTLSGFNNAYASDGSQIDWGNGRYVMLGTEPTPNPEIAILDDVRKIGAKYNITLKLFEANGSLVKVLSQSGQIFGKGDQGFMYESNGYGTFFSARRANAGGSIKYSPSIAKVTKMSELQGAKVVAAAVKDVTLNVNSQFFKNKYTKDQAWDVQRSPAYPSAGRDWTLSGLKDPLDARKGSIDWGNGRYMMFVAEADDNARTTITDDASGRKLRISQKLYERNGTLVKELSNWGQIIGVGAKGYMYVAEGDVGTFIPTIVVTRSDVVTYRPTTMTVSRVSELPSGIIVPEVRQQVVPVAVNSQFFKNKYTKDQAWDVQRSPAYPSAGRDWTLSGLKDPLDARQGSIDWGNGRYMMFVAEADDNARTTITDDASGRKLRISQKLYERNGTLVKELSNWGQIIGVGAKGYMYVAEGDVGTFIPTIVVTRSDVVTYRPTTMTVSRVSELPSGIIVASAPEFFTSKYTKDQVWDVQRSPAYPVAGRDWTLSGLKSALDASRSAIDWGNGRYLKFISEIDNTNSPTSLFDETTGKRYKISLNLYEQNGSLVKVASRWGNLIGKGAKGFMYVAEGDVGMFFPAMPVRSTDVITYRPTNLTVTQLSQIK